MSWFEWLVGSLLGGAIAGLAAAAIWHVFMSLRVSRQHKRLQGIYSGYGFVDEEANPLRRRDDPQSTAHLTHYKRNILNIVVTHDDAEWRGVIHMEHPDSGTVTWRYTHHPEPHEAFGFKRMIVHQERRETKLYMVEEQVLSGQRHFNREVFIRQE